MKTEVLEATPEAIARAAALIRNGELAAFPTETVYGLGANALDPEAVAKIFIAKGRPSYNPLIVHAKDLDSARALVTDWPRMAQQLAERFWPGPLTLVLPKQDSIPDIVTGGGPTVALRIPAHPVALALLQASSVPIAAPSANRSLQVSPTRAAHVLHSLAGRIPLILDGGPTTGGLESTVLSLVEATPVLLRPGLVSPAEIEAIIGPISRSAHPSSSGESALPAPGMMKRHYAPRAVLEITEHARERVRQIADSGTRVGWLTFPSNDALIEAPEMRESNPRIMVRAMPSRPEEYAARLYETLHALDADGVSHIIVDRLPGTEAWLAIRDRLNRASAAEDEQPAPDR